MPTLEDFENWVTTVHGGQAQLGAKFDPPVGQSTISAWITKKRVPAARHAELEKLGWPGPYSWDDPVTREDLEQLQKNILSHQGWLLEEIRKGDVALAAMLGEVLKRLGPPKES